MICSSHRFIFVHYPKTGGNSIQDALREYADDEITSKDNHQDGRERFDTRHPKYSKLNKHSKLQDYYNALGEELNSYKVYTTIRNPFDRLVSFYFSPHRGDVIWSEGEFARFVKKIPTLDKFLAIRTSLLSRKKINPGQVVDFLRFEDIDADFARMCREVGIKEKHLPHRNKSTTRRDYRECYSDELKDWVFANHNYEIEAGSYSFD